MYSVLVLATLGEISRRRGHRMSACRAGAAVGTGNQTVVANAGIRSSELVVMIPSEKSTGVHAHEVKTIGSFPARGIPI